MGWISLIKKKFTGFSGVCSLLFVYCVKSSCGNSLAVSVSGIPLALIFTPSYYGKKIRLKITVTPYVFLKQNLNSLNLIIETKNYHCWQKSLPFAKHFRWLCLWSHHFVTSLNCDSARNNHLWTTFLRRWFRFNTGHINMFRNFHWIVFFRCCRWISVNRQFKWFKSCLITSVRDKFLVVFLLQWYYSFYCIFNFIWNSIQLNWLNLN